MQSNHSFKKQRAMEGLPAALLPFSLCHRCNRTILYIHNYQFTRPQNRNRGEVVLKKFKWYAAPISNIRIMKLHIKIAQKYPMPGRVGSTARCDLSVAATSVMTVGWVVVTYPVTPVVQPRLAGSQCDYSSRIPVSSCEECYTFATTHSPQANNWVIFRPCNWSFSNELSRARLAFSYWCTREPCIR